MVSFVEAVGFGGAFALGATQAGLEMVGKVERPDGFGASNSVSNRHLLGEEWELQIDREGDGSGWDEIPCEVVLGNPPCSGFSLLTQTKGFRGVNSPINKHMWALLRYAARVKPLVVMFESVQGAYFQGSELMHALHAELEEMTGSTWYLTHVLHNNLSLGGCAMRRRYFWVASRVPFGVERMKLQYVPTADDALHDLEPLADTWLPQPYRSPPTRWSRALRAPDGLVDGHVTTPTPNFARAKWIADNLGGWPEGAPLEDLCREHYKRFGCLPGEKGRERHDPRLGYQYMVRDKQAPDGVEQHITREQHLLRREFSMGPTQLNRWRANRHAYVITGGALTEYVHPHVLRTFTHREAARIQGFPDAWKISPQRWDAKLPAVWGKGVPVHSGKWIAHWVKESIEGRPGSVTGDPDNTAGAPDGARVINVTNDWQQYLGEDVREYMARTR